MPTKRYSVSAGLVKYSDGSEHIVVAGGNAGGDNQKSSVTEIFDLQTLTWSVGDHLPFKLEDGESVPFEDSFLIVGGEEMPYNYVDSILFFNPIFQEWEQRNETMKRIRTEFATFMVPNSYANCL